jgi:hypothetical protein
MTSYDLALLQSVLASTRKQLGEGFKAESIALKICLSC